MSETMAIVEEIHGIVVDDLSKDNGKKEKAIPEKTAPQTTLMSIRVCRATLETALAKAVKFTDPRGTMPILANVLIRADSFAGTISLRASDLQLVYRAEILGIVEVEGAVCLNAKNLYEIVKGANAEYICITEELDQWAKVSSEGVEAKLPSLPVKDFVSELKITNEPICEVDAPELLRKLTSVAAAISADKSKFTLNGVLFELEHGEGKLVATDGHKLFFNVLAPRIKLSPNTADKQEFIMPREILKIVAVWAKSDEPLLISRHESHLKVASQTETVFARLLEGQFPDYKRVMKGEHKITVKVNGARLAEALRQVDKLSDKHTVKLVIAERSITILNRQTDKGKAKTELECNSTGTITIGYNANYLLKALAGAPANIVDMRIISESEATIITNGQFRAIVMPMSV